MPPLSRNREFSFPTQLLGKQVYHFEQLASTNTTALQLAEEGAVEGTLVLADSQSAGHGRGNHGWHSPPGAGLYLSLILRPDLKLSAICPLTLSVGIAAAQALTRLSGIEVQVKWPNDLILRDKKVGGILLETVSQQKQVKHLVIGIGININQSAQEFPPGLQERATSLQAETGMIFERSKVLEQLLLELEETYFLFLRQGLKPLIPQFNQLDYLNGEEVRVNTPSGLLQGETAGIDETGALLLRLPGANKLKRIISGSAQLIRGE
jgi:BirA family biotin operon repressor/biotin-[acetyl-CoA-carboxylase] ligase